MGKILDTITVLFKGDTEDLKRKKKEAEDIAAETAKNIQEIQASTADTNATLDTTNKNLTQTQSLTDNIGEGIAAWYIAAQHASASITEALSADAAHREQLRIEAGLKATKKGAEEVEKALKGVVKQFAAAALGSLTIGKAIGSFKNDVGETLNLQRSAFSLNIPAATIDAYGQASKPSGGSTQEVINALQTISEKYSHATGEAVWGYFLSTIDSIQKAKTGESQEAIGGAFGFSENLIRAARTGAFSPNNLVNINRVDSNIEGATKAVSELSAAWAKLSTQLHGTALDIETALPVLTAFLTILDVIIAHATSGIHSINYNPDGTPKYVGVRNPVPLTVPLIGSNSAVRGPVTIHRTTNIHMQSPRGTDPDYFARAIQVELDKAQSQRDQLIHQHDNSIVG